MGTQKALHAQLPIKIEKQYIQVVRNLLGNSMAKICAVTNDSWTRECGVLWPNQAFQDEESYHDARRPPSICANIAIIINEMASTSHRYGYLENDVSSLSARHIN
jgi:hypothetical protein